MHKIGLLNYKLNICGVVYQYSILLNISITADVNEFSKTGTNFYKTYFIISNKLLIKKLDALFINLVKL